MIAARTLRTVIAAAAALAVFGSPGFAAHDADYAPEVAPTWETTIDGGMLSADVGRHAVASKSRNNSVESLFVTAVRVKSDALQAIGINDFDTVTTAFDTATGAVRWTTEYDAGLGIFDQPTGMELNYNNNVLHVVVQSDSDTSIVTYSVSSGAESKVATLSGVEVNDTAINVSGSEMAVVGQSGGDFFFADYESGPDAFTIESTPVSGEAFGVAIHDKTWINSGGVSDWAPGNTDSWRTFVVTGRTGNFASANQYTAAYRTDQTGHAPVWSHTFDGPDGDWDEGLASEVGYVRATGQTFAWTAGRTRDASGNWDIVVIAYDLNTGTPAWTGTTRTWGGAGGTEDAPAAMWYADATQTLYVTGTTDRGFPHGTDIVTLAFDALTGDARAEVLSSGDISNGDDWPVEITTTHAGDRVFVAAEFHDLVPTGGGKRRAGLFAFDALLNPAGTGFLSEGGFGVDQAGGVAVDIDQTHVLIGGSTDLESNDDDLAGAAFPLEDFEVLPEPGGVAAIALCVPLLLSLARRRNARI